MRRIKWAALFVLAFFVSNCWQDFSEYDRFVEPQILEKSSQKMLVYKVVGDPNQTVGVAMKALYSAFFAMKKQYDLELFAPRARWPQPVDVPREEWIGIYGIPITESVQNIPQKILEKYPELCVETWEYGIVAEILHVGPYSTEHTTVKKLHKFIERNGYKISGTHEEEYLKSRGMFFKGNPEKYKTLIRYPVQK